MTGYTSFTGQFGQNEATFYSGQIGFNVALDALASPIVTKIDIAKRISLSPCAMAHKVECGFRRLRTSVPIEAGQ